MLSRQPTSWPHDMHADGGLTIERRIGTRATTTLRKLPRASPGASANAASASVTSYAPAPGSARLRANRSKGCTRLGLARRADTPKGLDAAVDLDQGLERLGPVPPAEPRTVDQPVVLVEPVLDVGRRVRLVRVEPPAEQSG